MAPESEHQLTELMRLQKKLHEEALRRWDLPVVGRDRSQQAWQWFGRGEYGVIAGLCDLLDRILQRPRGRFRPAAIGCVPWFNHAGVAQRLAAMPSCIVINKPGGRISPAAMELHRRGQPIQSEWFVDLHDLAPAEPDGTPRLPGPWDRIGSSLGPLRVYGHRQRRGERTPLLHTKMLVLGGSYESDYGVHFRPDVVWIGSANWTIEAERDHIEAAVAVADRSFVQAATNHVTGIISSSEPMERYSAAPTPNLVPTELDMEAFVDYTAEFNPGYAADDT